MAKPANPLSVFHAPVREWFQGSFPGPTAAQARGWPPILAGESTLLLAPTGSGKTLAAFLAAIDRLMFSPEPPRAERCRVLYVSPLKALLVDVERNLRAPLAGIAAAAGRLGVPCSIPTVAVRSGDTPAAERARAVRAPPDILITTPESLYLLLTSSARATLRSIDAVIIDEIHSLAASKRGAHLFLSLERLEALRPPGAARLQRIGLSATLRPSDEFQRLLGGGDVPAANSPWRQRSVTLADAGRKKAFELTIEMPIADLARPGGNADSTPEEGPAARSLWPAIYPRLVELIRARRSTLIFANSRRLAERLAAALNEAAGEELALAHHGSLAREERLRIEERLKRGDLPALVATSSLELGIDMGAIDLVVQIEAPPSVASGMQRIGRASHAAGAVSRGVIFPKHRGDLLACAAATARMQAGEVEELRYPRNPLDVLAQHVVAMAAMETLTVEGLYALVRRAAPFADLPWSSFTGLLDMLTGRYPSEEFAELRPRLTWDRIQGTVRARDGARRVAVVNGGTIPDRGLYSVFLGDGDARRSRRVGELDEEMVFESRPGDVFVLGASSWRIQEITHDRVLVAPAPGEPGKMPFWHGDRPARALAFGRAIGALARRLAGAPRREAERRLEREHGLDARAAANLIAYLREQVKATGDVPSDRTVIVEWHRDEVGDWRLTLLSPFGAAVHAPWAMAVLARLDAATESGAGMMWSDDGFVFRVPGAEPPDASVLLLEPDEVQDLVLRSLGGTALFAARFRENAARALLLPRRRPGGRSPLWAQRRRAGALLAAAGRHPTFPILIETYRECLQDVFDLPGLIDVLKSIQTREVRVITADSGSPSPFAASLLYSYVANFIYDGDAPLAERKAQALSVDPAQLRELLGEAELRELLDGEAITSLEAFLQRRDGERPARSPDGLHDLLLAVGDLSPAEASERSSPPGNAAAWMAELEREGRVFPLTVAGERRHAAAEDAARYRDALGISIPDGLPPAFLEPVADPLAELVSRYARTHGPFPAASAATRLGASPGTVIAALRRLAAAGRAIEGNFLPGGHGPEWCDPEVLRSLKQRSLARLRQEVEAVEPAALGRLLVEWQGLLRPRAANALREVIGELAGAPLPASVLETEILPARLAEYRPADLDLLCAGGNVVWRGIEPVGAHDGRIALYPAGHYELLAPPAGTAEGELAARVREVLAAKGAVFYPALAAAIGAFSGDLVRALWELVWSGEATNDTLAPLRAYLRGAARRGARRRRGGPGMTAGLRGRPGPPGSEGRWSLLPLPGAPGAPAETRRCTALARALIERHGVLTREAAAAEGVPGGFSTVYPVLKALEEAGRARRGYFVAGLGATQFAAPGAGERLRSLRLPSAQPRTFLLSAMDPANPYGAALPWPERDGARLERRAGAQVLLRDGMLIAYIGRAERDLLTFLPTAEPERGQTAVALAAALASRVEEGRRSAFLVSRIDGQDPDDSQLAPYLRAAGFTPGARGYLKRVEAVG